MTATLDGYRITRGELLMTHRGAWRAAVELDTDAELSGAVTLVIDGLSLTGQVRRGDALDGDGSYSVDPCPGWGQTVVARHYHSAAGVMLSMVLGDLAREVGETLASGYTDRDLGSHYVRPAAPAGQVLAELVGDGWYADDAGQTVIGSRTTGSVDGVVDWSLEDYDEANRMATVATEAAEAFRPGLSLPVAGQNLVISTVQIDIEPRRSRLRLWLDHAAQADRLSAALTRLVRYAAPRTYLGIYEYRVVAQSGNVLDVAPVEASIGLPPMQQVSLRPGIPGASATVKVGSRVLVSFVNGQPSRPFVMAFEDPDGQGFVSPLLSIEADAVELADAVAAVLRDGELVNITGVQPGTGITGATISVNPATFPGFGKSAVKA